MKKFLLLLLLPILAACSQVEPGHVGVKVYLLGSSKGVDHEVLGVGRYYIGVNEQLYVFPIFTQTHAWTKDATEGSPTDESITFQSKEGLEFNADVGISYHVDPDKVADVFQKYRKGVEEITHTFLRNQVRNAIVSLSSTMTVDDVYGVKKAELLKHAYEKVRDENKDIGIVVEDLYWVGSIRLPLQVKQAIDDKISATQKAIQKENEVASATADANKERERARGEADAIGFVGEALRRNPEVIRLKQLEKWDGKLPVYMGGSGPMPFLDLSQK